VTESYARSKRLGDIAGPFLFSQRAQRLIVVVLRCVYFGDAADECAGNRCCRIVTHGL